MNRVLCKQCKILTISILRKYATPSVPVHLEEIGKFDLETPEKFTSGQCFLHRVFAYRGVILFPWKASLLDRDKRDKPKICTYYQVLMDERDSPYVRTQSEIGNFTGRGPGRWMFCISGLDHVPHEDVIPYKPTIAKPINHGLFDKYFTVRPSRCKRWKDVVPRLRLHSWRRRHVPWLFQTQVHKMTTEKVKVTAMSFYMGRRRLTHWWRYCVRVENFGEGSLILQGQRWGIYIGNGELKTVKGVGVAGKLPVLTPEEPAMQYCSQVSLMSPRGHMWGYYLVQRQPGGRTFLCPVPSFTLESTLARDPLRSITK